VGPAKFTHHHAVGQYSTDGEYVGIIVEGKSEADDEFVFDNFVVTGS